MSTSHNASKTGPELLDDIVQHPTLNRFLDRDPHAQPLSDEELMEVLVFERGERAKFETREQKARDKKAGIETTPKKDPEQDPGPGIMNIDSDVAD